MKKFLLGNLAVLAIGITIANAEVPKTISYQGLLGDGSGNPSTDTSATLTFRLYTMAGREERQSGKKRRAYRSPAVSSPLFWGVPPLLVSPLTGSTGWVYPSTEEPNSALERRSRPHRTVSKQAMSIPGRS
jgi:hypothetical protein